MTFTLAAIARLIGVDIPENAGQIIIKGIASIEDAGPDEVAFVANPRYRKYIATTNAGAVILSRDAEMPLHAIPLVVDNPYMAFVKVLEAFDTRSPKDIADGIHELAVIDPSAHLDEGVSIGPCAIIGAGVRIGEGTTVGACSVIMKDTSIGARCILYPHVVIMDGCEVGDRVILHAGVVVGSDGFGFVPFEGRLRKIPQIGSVRIGDDVEIGACSCIDRAAFGVTIIGNGTKIDNLVQIAHNVKIGCHTVIASQTGISGSTTIGSGVKIGGQAGFAGHLHVEDGSSVGAQAGVTKDVTQGETVSGYPAKNHMKAMRMEASLRALPDMIAAVKRQEKKIEELERIIKEQKQKDV